MTREERIKYLAKELYYTTLDEKTAKGDREDIKGELFKLLDDEYSTQQHRLPVITVEVPGTFFTDTGLTKEQFASSRYPGWDVEHCEMNINTNTIVFVLKRNPGYVSGVVEFESNEGDMVRVSREVSEYEPEIDWDTLKKERPDLYKALAKRKMMIQVNEQALSKLVDEAPEDIVVLQRHMKVRQPALKARARLIKDKDNG